LKRIYFSINGIGYGHASRILQLIKLFLKKGYAIYVSTYNEGYIYLSNYFKNIFTTHGINYYFDEEGRLSFKKTIVYGLPKFLIVFPLHLALEIRNLKKIDPELVISDSRFSTILASKLLKKKSFIIVNQLYVEIPRIAPMNVLLRHLKRLSERIFFELWFWACNKSDLILIPDFEPPFTISSNTLAVKSSKDLKKIKFIGPLINVNNNSTQNNFNTILIMPSGTIQERLIAIKRILQNIHPLINSNIKFRILTGLHKIKKITNKNIEILPWIEEEELTNLISEAKLLILTGGHSSIMKAIVNSKPMLFIVPRAHTEKQKNALKISQLGCGLMLYLDELNPEFLKNSVNEMIQNINQYISNVNKIKQYNKNIEILNIMNINYE
jgi:uncharacterized protein (TIGR00661 family)